MKFQAIFPNDPSRPISCLLVAALLAFGSDADSAAGSAAISLRSDVPFTNHVHRHYSDREGLPSNWIYDIVQTRDGYVWIATHNGVVRYDGLRFTVFSRSNTPQLPANDTRVLYQSRDGSLWIGTVGGLARFRPGRPGTFERFDVFAGNSVHAILEDSVGNLWIGTREETWLRKPTGDFEVAEDAPADVKAICEDAAGTLWLGSDTGLYRRQNATIQRVDHPRFATLVEGTNASVAGVTALLAEGNGVWVGCSHGLLRIESGEFAMSGEEVGQRRVNDLLKTRDGCLYAATNTGLYRSFGGNPFVELQTEARTQCMMEDREGGLWVGHTIDRGLHYFRNSKTRRLLGEHRVNCLHGDVQGDIWFGAFSGLHRLCDGELSHYGVADGLPHVNVQAIAQGTGGTLWIGTRQGLAKWSGGRLAPVIEPSDLAQLDIAAIMVDARGVLWLSLAGRGGRRYYDGVVENIRELEHGKICWFHEDSSGTLWIGHEYGLFRREDGRIRQVTDPALERLNNRHFTCYFAARDGTLWLGTSGGIARYQAGRFETVTSEHGLAADYVDRIHQDSHGNLWFAGRDGFFYVSERELHEVASGQRGRLISHRVEPVEGVSISHYQPKAHLGKDGTMWMAANPGVIRVSPEPWARAVPPAVQIERVQVDGKTLPGEHTFKFLSGRHRLAIDFAAATFFNRHNVRVRYRLDGSDADWVEAGDERVAYYTDLAPGDYRFQIIAANGDVWNEQGATIDLVVQPRWWERTEARLAMALGLAALGSFYLRYRIRRYRQANIALRREIADRERAEEAARRHRDELARVNRVTTVGELATSIAHEVNQPLSAIVSNAQAALRLLGQPQPDTDEVTAALQDISNDGNRAAGILNRVRSMARKDLPTLAPLNFNEVVRDVLRLTAPDAEVREIVIREELDDGLPTIIGNRIQLQQVILNLLINAVQAMRNVEPDSRRLTVRTANDGGSVHLSVKDCGVGLEDEQLKQIFDAFYTSRVGGIGMGLSISQSIIEAHEGKIWATQNPDRGATFHVTLPGAD